MPRRLWPCINSSLHICSIGSSLVHLVCLLHSFGLSLASTFISIMAYEPTNFYIPLDSSIKNSTLLFYPPQSLLPGEAASSAYYSYGPSGIPGPVHAPNLTHPGPLTPRRRSSYSNNSYPYPISHHDTPRSPTRSRFNLHDPNIPSSENVFHSPTRSRFPSNCSGFLGPERHNKSYRRPNEDCVSQSPRKPSNTPAVPIGPTNHILIPQAPLEEPGSSRSHYRYPDITFHVAKFPEMGVKVGALNRTKIPLLSGAEDLVLQDVQDREIKIRISWPGYSDVSFERRMKTLHGSAPRTRISVAIKLAQMILEFANHLRLTRAQVEPGKEQWMIDFSGTMGISCSDVFITRLVHCGGSHWQIELWAPKEMVQAA